MSSHFVVNSSSEWQAAKLCHRISNFSQNSTSSNSYTGLDWTPEIVFVVRSGRFLTLNYAVTVHRSTKMRVVKLLVTLLMLTMNVHSAGVRGRDRVNSRRHRYRHNPYDFVPATETVAVDYEEVEVSSYCRESVAHHESYVRAMTQATTASSKVPYCSVLMALFFSDKRLKKSHRSVIWKSLLYHNMSWRSLRMKILSLNLPRS